MEAITPNPQLGEAWNVSRMQELGVLGTPAWVTDSPLCRRNFPEDLRIDIQHLPVGTVADGVRLHLNTRPQGAPAQRAQFVRWYQEQARRVRIVIRCQQCGPTRP